MNTIAENENLTWELEDGVLSIAGKGKIPDYYIGKNPKAPWDEVAKDIQELEIGSGVTEIGVAAFCKCKNMTLAVLPNTLVRIHYGAFEGCTSLEDVLYDPEMSFVHMYEKTEKSTKRFHSIREKEKSQQIITFGMRAFKETPWAIENWGDYYVSANILIDVLKEQKNVVIPDRIEEIGTMAFQNLDVKTVTFPQSLKIIDNFAFENTKLTSVVVPSGVRKVGYGAFAHTPLEKVLFAGSTQADIDPQAFANTDVLFDDKNLFIYEMKEESWKVSGVNKLGIKMKEIKYKAKKKEGIIGYESADIYSSVIKMAQAGQALVGITYDEWSKKLTAVETVSWSKKDKKPIYMKFDPVELEQYEEASVPEGERVASRPTRNDLLSIFPGTDAKAMIADGGIVAPQGRIHAEWFAVADKKQIFGKEENRIVEVWLRLHKEYTR